MQSQREIIPTGLHMLGLKASIAFFLFSPLNWGGLNQGLLGFSFYPAPLKRCHDQKLLGKLRLFLKQKINFAFQQTGQAQ